MPENNVLPMKEFKSSEGCRSVEFRCEVSQKYNCLTRDQKQHAPSLKLVLLYLVL